MPPSPKLKILFLGANPKNTTRLRIDEELREIDQQLRLSTARERLSLAQAWAVRADDLQQSFIDNEPQIVHFSGHGDTAGIAIEDEHGNARLIANEAVSDLFGIFKDNIKCVLLNACYSETQAKAILQHIPYVIGMRSEMPDEAAIRFSVGFYKAIAAGKTVEFAFSLGVNAIKLEGIDATLVPVLMKSQNDLQLLPNAEVPVLSQTQDNAIPKKTLWKWVVGGGVITVVAGIIGFFVAKNMPSKELSYRIGDAKVDLYKNTKDSLLMTFELVCDNNTSKNLQFVRDSVTLSFEDLDKKFKTFHDGAPIVRVDKRENKTVTVCFVTPMRFKPVSIYIAQKHGTARVDYGFGNLVTNSNLPIADANTTATDELEKNNIKPSKEGTQSQQDTISPPPKSSSIRPPKNGKPTRTTTTQPVPISPVPSPVPVAPSPIVKAEPKVIPDVVNQAEMVTITGGDIAVSPAVIAAMRKQNIIKSPALEERKRVLIEKIDEQGAKPKLLKPVRVGR